MSMTGTNLQKFIVPLNVVALPTKIDFECPVDWKPAVLPTINLTITDAFLSRTNVNFDIVSTPRTSASTKFLFPDNYSWTSSPDSSPTRSSIASSSPVKNFRALKLPLIKVEEEANE